MKKIVISLISILSASIFYSCKKADNLTPAPTAALDSAIVAPKEQANVLRQTSISNVPNGSTVTLKLTFNASAGFEQIDYKVYGDQTVWTGDRPDKFVNGSNVELKPNNVPFDWVSLNSIRNGFDSEKSTKMLIRFPNVNQVTKISFIITDKNFLQSYFDVVITPVNFGASASNVTLYTQTASLSDVGGTASDKKLKYSLNKIMAYDTTSSNGQAEFAVVNDSLHNVWILSANLLKADSLKKYGVAPATLVNLSTKIIESGSLSIGTTTLNATTASIADIITHASTGLTNKIKIESGKSYFFTTGNNQSGVITINSIQDAPSSEKNAIVNFSFKSVTLRQ